MENRRCPVPPLYADWVRTQNESYRSEGIKRLTGSTPPHECVNGPPATENLKLAKWKLAVDLVASAKNLESTIHAVERVPSAGQGQPARFIPIRFIFTNKLTKDDKLLMAFDALVVSETLDREVTLGRIIHGDNHATLTVKTSVLAGEVRKISGNVETLLSANAPPDLILNRHCAECEFQSRCRQMALEKDDLSLLPRMTGKERKEYNGKGIFTITQLSYTFRPRRRPKQQKEKREKYHHELKALAIREKKIHIVGNPELKIEGTPIYLDVEGIPDREFYYLIGVRVKTTQGNLNRSFWADDCEAEKTIWRDFVGFLAGIPNPCLIHYGSFESQFVKRMISKYGGCSKDVFERSVNVLSTIFGQIYYPTFSNGLKEIAKFLGFKWTEADASGTDSIIWRDVWEAFQDPAIKAKLVTYNAEDCEALALITETIPILAVRRTHTDNTEGPEIIAVDAPKSSLVGQFRVFSSPLSELEFITKAAHWDYQRDRIHVRSDKRLMRARRKAKTNPKSAWRVEVIIECETSNKCPRCHRKGIKKGPVRCRNRQEMLFGRCSLKRRVIQYQCQLYWCPKCKELFGDDRKLIKRGQPGKYGRSLPAYLLYQIIELSIPARIVAEHLRRIFGLYLNTGILAMFKRQMADYYAETHKQILKRIVSGELVHADETHANIKGKDAWVWVFTNMREVVYLYSETREGDLVREHLGNFKGVLVSDFYAVYDSLACSQQKCLIHLTRDLNGEILDNPYDEDLKHIVKDFGVLLQGIIEDVDRHGLRKYFLRKHLVSVGRFYRETVRVDYHSAAAVACKERFEKNRDKLFTFLRFDGVPWNNNNAEHAIKAFGRLRDVMKGSSTENGFREYLILLSVCQTCKYQGLDFLNFLRSGEEDIDEFAKSEGRKR